MRRSAIYLVSFSLLTAQINSLNEKNVAKKVMGSLGLLPLLSSMQFVHFQGFKGSSLCVGHLSIQTAGYCSCGLHRKVFGSNIVFLSLPIADTGGSMMPMKRESLVSFSNLSVRSLM